MLQYFFYQQIKDKIISNKMYIKLNKSLLNIAFLFILVISVETIYHKVQKKNIEELQYAKLNQQQKYLEDSINNLVEGMMNVQRNVSKSVNSTQKVVLLEQAILSQRQKVFNISNQVIPPFSLSKTACLQLTNQQKIDMLDKIKTTKQQLTALQKDIVTAPKCDRINNLQKDALKQILLLQSLQKTIYTECQSKSILTPTIYQSNVYADGWILGDQHIDDLVEEYYQRNIKYHNITNCPLEKPFFNGVQCIICKDPDPVFNILTRQCTKCPQDQQADSALRQCAWEPHYTNFSWVDNWAQDGAPMPVPKRNILPCPIQKPYYNGKKCQICHMPKYWSIKKNACVQCLDDTVFDVNDKKCQKPQTNDLTILQGTRWITNDCNLTRIIEKRVKVLQKNATTKIYKMCPQTQPYYDGIVCITCPNQFNIDTRKCVQRPNKTTAYDQNVRCYVQKQTGFETDLRAPRYTIEIALVDTTVPNCKKAKPYYDGIACIDCLQPFPIFDVPTKRCTNCDPMQEYNSTAHKCIARQKIYISTNEQRLMATQKMSIEDYHEQIKQRITDNPNAVVLLCQSTQYSNYKNCLNCPSLQYFNVQTKQCQICDGTINKQTRVCAEKQYFYTNLNQYSITRIKAVPSNTTLQKENNTINQNLKKHVNSKLCPSKEPYYDGNACTNCSDQLFNYTIQQCAPMVCDDPKYPFFNKQTKKCQQCPAGTRYQAKPKRCQSIVYVTNTNAIYYYIQVDNYTKASLQDQIFKLQANNSVTTCDASHPYWNGTNCIECAITRNKDDLNTFKPYFNLKSLKCQACQNYDNITHKCKDTTQLTCRLPTPVLDTATNSCKPCPESTVWSPETKTCEKCAIGQIYNATAKQCQTWVTKIDALDNNYIQEKDGTKQNLVNKIQQLKKNQTVNVCPTSAPYFSSKQLKCITCSDPTPYFNLYTQSCIKCDNYDFTTHTCQQALPRFKVNVQDFYSTIFG